MNYSIENINTCTKKLSFKFESVDLSNEINEALKEKQKGAKLKGYRPGKAPLSMIQSMYGPQVENDALYRFVTKEFYEAIQTEGIKAIGYPKFSDTNYEVEKKNISFVAEVETFPEFEVGNYSKYEFEKTSDEVTAKDFDDVKNQMLSSRSEMVEVTKPDQALEKSHFATMNFQGVKEDGERPENMKGTDYVLEIGSGQFIPGFEEKMEGMKKGEKKNIELTFPEDYHSEDLKGAKVTFEVELLEIKEKKLPEYNDEILKEFGFESTSDFEERTNKRLIAEKKRKSDETLHQKILEKLVADNEFDVPATLIVNQVNSLKEETKANLLRSGLNEQMLSDYYSKWEDDFKQRATFQVRSGLILEKLAAKYEVKVEESDLDEKFQAMADLSSTPIDQVKTIYGGNEKLKQNLTYAIREEKTFDAIKKEIIIK